MIDNPNSKFLKVKCTDCENTQTIFDRTNLKISCNVCGATLALPMGGKGMSVFPQSLPMGGKGMSVFP